jgi:hypothetical protein
MFMPRRTDKMSLEEKVQLLMDERDIRSLEYRWCRAVDRADLELMKSCFHEDAVDHHAPFFDSTVKELAETFVEGSKSMGLSMQYNIGNMLIEIDGDVARSECYCWSQKTLHVRSDNGHKLMRISGLRYLDRLERRNGEWRIAERWFIPEWGFFKEVPEMTKTVGPFVPPSEMILKPIAARRDGTDQSYMI